MNEAGINRKENFLKGNADETTLRHPRIDRKRSFVTKAVHTPYIR